MVQPISRLFSLVEGNHDIEEIEGDHEEEKGKMLMLLPG